jgi:hypothetical protein
MNTISSVSNSNAYNPQITNKVAAANSINLANNAANQSAFSSYIGQALAQIGVANPTSSSARVVSSADKANTAEQSLSSFIQDLFSILTEKDSSRQPVESVSQQLNLKQAFSQENESTESSSDSESSGINEAALAAYTAGNSTTAGNLATNLQAIVKQLNDESRNTDSTNSSAIQALKNGFQNVLNAQGANSDNNQATLGNFLKTLADNLEGQSPLGIIINTQA